jgi:hypothetical protein
MKKLSTVSLKAEMTVRQAVQEIAKSGRFQHPENFTLYHADGTSRKWLEDDHTLAHYGITAQVRSRSATAAFRFLWTPMATFCIFAAVLSKLVVTLVALLGYFICWKIGRRWLAIRI